MVQNNSINKHVGSPGYTFPNVDATVSGQMLQTNGSGSLSWSPTYVNTWTNYPVTLIASGATNPTQGSGSLFVGSYSTAANGKILFISVYFKQSVLGTNGTGTYIFSIPSGFTINVPVMTTSATPLLSSICGTSFVNYNNSQAFGAGQVYIYTANQLQISTSNNLLSGGRTSLVGSTNVGLGSSANIIYTFNAWVPVV